jgi:hypothetical protein
MRTTVTLEEDLAKALKQRAHDRGVPFKRALNEALRAGLEHDAEPRRYRVPVAALGPARVDLTKALRLAADLEDSEAQRKLELGR